MGRIDAYAFADGAGVHVLAFPTDQGTATLPLNGILRQQLMKEAFAPEYYKGRCPVAFEAPPGKYMVVFVIEAKPKPPAPTLTQAVAAFSGAQDDTALADLWRERILAQLTRLNDLP